MSRRLDRAAELEKSIPAAAGVLQFYRRILEFQESADRRVESLLRLVARYGPDALAQSAQDLLDAPAEWEPLMHCEQTEPARWFFAEVLRQPGEAERARRAAKSATVTGACPFCGEPPLLAILCPEGDGGKRYLLCGRCSTEWEFRRLLCPHCGEEDQDKLAVYTAEEFPHIRVEACDTCRRYLKAIDLTRNGLAVPEVDEMASLPLDLWASGKGYTKLRPNLFGM